MLTSQSMGKNIKLKRKIIKYPIKKIIRVKRHLWRRKLFHNVKVNGRIEAGQQRRIKRRMRQTWKWRGQRKGYRVWKQFRFAGSIQIGRQRVYRLRRRYALAKVKFNYLRWKFRLSQLNVTRELGRRYLIDRNTDVFNGKECRLDIIIICLGVCRNITVARKFINKKKVSVNGGVVNNINFKIGAGDLIQFAEKLNYFQLSLTKDWCVFNRLLNGFLIVGLNTIEKRKDLKNKRLLTGR
jgi:ribosomal protein S4